MTLAAHADVAQFWPAALVATRVLDHLTVARLAKEAQQARAGPHRLLVSFTDSGSIGGRVRPLTLHTPSLGSARNPIIKSNPTHNPGLSPDPSRAHEN